MAERQHGVVALRQLYALAYTRQQVRTRTRGGRLHRCHRGVYAVGHARLTLRGRWMAAVLACGDGAALSHEDAATLHGLRRTGYGDIHVTATERHNLPGIRCHWTRTPPESTVIDGIPVTTLARTLLDLAATSGRRRFMALLEQAQRDDVLDLLTIDALITRHPGHHGIAPLRAGIVELEDDPPWTQSELERRFLALARDHGLPLPSTNVYVEGELVDACWPGAGLVVEVDGWRTHRTRRAFEDDRRRDAVLVTAGYRVLRVTYRRLRDEPAVVAEQIRQLLGDAAVPRRPSWRL